MKNGWIRSILGSVGSKKRLLANGRQKARTYGLDNVGRQILNYVLSATRPFAESRSAPSLTKHRISKLCLTANKVLSNPYVRAFWLFANNWMVRNVIENFITYAIPDDYWRKVYAFLV